MRSSVRRGVKNQTDSKKRKKKKEEAEATMAERKRMEKKELKSLDSFKRDIAREIAHSLRHVIANSTRPNPFIHVDGKLTKHLVMHYGHDAIDEYLKSINMTAWWSDGDRLCVHPIVVETREDSENESTKRESTRADVEHSSTEESIPLDVAQRTVTRAVVRVMRDRISALEAKIEKLQQELMAEKARADWAAAFCLNRARRTNNRCRTILARTRETNCIPRMNTTQHTTATLTNTNTNDSNSSSSSRKRRRRV